MYFQNLTFTSNLLLPLNFLKKKKLRQITIILYQIIEEVIFKILFQVFQQLSGINGVIFFAGDIFKAAKAESPTLCTIILGIVQTTATIVASILVDKAGRKILLIISSTGMAICLVALGYYFHLKDTGAAVSELGWLPLGSLVGFIIVFSLGFGPLPWMMSGEILSSEIKSVGSGCAVAVNWGCVSLVTFYFQPLCQSLSTAVTFWGFAVICSIATLFSLIMVPETKGKSMQQIQDELAGIKTVRQVNGNA